MKNKISRTLEKYRIPTSSSTRLRDFVRQIRAAKSPSEEKAIIERELANLRVVSFDENSKFKCRNMLKLIYIHMLGYSADFAQMECLKLVGAQQKKYTSLRIGYLGIMQMFNEYSEAHLLLTNSLRKHITDSDMFISGLTLNALGNVCSPEMSCDLINEIIKKFSSYTCNFVKKKAILCAFRSVQKVPQLIESTLPNSRSLLNEKYHGVLMSAIILVTEICSIDPDMRSFYKIMVPSLVRVLQNLQIVDNSPRYAMSGVSDPFLQIKILRLLRILGSDDADVSYKMKDILLQLVTFTGSFNPHFAILSEAVLTILGIQCDSGLKEHAINILDRFLVDSDKNNHYAGLSILIKAAPFVDLRIIETHRTTVLDSLKDEDMSIRRRAIAVCSVPRFSELLVENGAGNNSITTDYSTPNRFKTENTSSVSGYASVLDMSPAICMSLSSFNESSGIFGTPASHRKFSPNGELECGKTSSADDNKDSRMLLPPIFNDLDLMTL
ncbi:AP-1 complex subunit gamma-1 [Ditylenchus destructor]|uniref:AP-1 complex subunit gamma-1 n=1 Tax=Ditylenchus destructor TaxID=166010 RepID=A0AAD4R8L2_9BILA|nr:AP-1 complex subunit gamma-1 [Ditylenchus destructor]